MGDPVARGLTRIIIHTRIPLHRGAAASAACRRKCRQASGPLARATGSRIETSTSPGRIQRLATICDIPLSSGYLSAYVHHEIGAA